jgi:hypothetical protein
MLEVWKATAANGETCHFGVEATARAWARSGTVERIELRDPPQLHSVATKHEGRNCTEMARHGALLAALDALEDNDNHAATVILRTLIAGVSVPDGETFSQKTPMDSGEKNG